MATRPALFVFGLTAGVAFVFGATADVSRLVKQIPGDSAKSQKQITLLGEEIFWVSSDIDCRVSTIDGYRTKELRTLIIFRGCHKARDFDSADSKAA